MIFVVQRLCLEIVSSFCFLLSCFSGENHRYTDRSHTLFIDFRLRQEVKIWERQYGNYLQAYSGLSLISGLILCWSKIHGDGLKDWRDEIQTDWQIEMPEEPQDDQNQKSKLSKLVNSVQWQNARYAQDNLGGFWGSWYFSEQFWGSCGYF